MRIKHILNICAVMLLASAMISGCNTQHKAEAQYNSDVAALCNYRNSGMLQEYNGEIYQIVQSGQGLELYRGKQVGSLDSKIVSSIYAPGFWIVDGWIYFQNDSDAISRMSIDGTESEHLLEASPIEFVVTSSSVYWTDSTSGTVSHFALDTQRQTQLTDFPAYSLQENDETLIFLSFSEANDETTLYEVDASGLVQEKTSFPGHAHHCVRVDDTVYVFFDYTILEWHNEDTEFTTVMTNYLPFDTSVNAYDSGIIWSGMGEDGYCSYYFAPSMESPLKLDSLAHQFIFSFEGGLWEYSISDGFTSLHF